MTEIKSENRMKGLQFWLLVWGFGIAGQLCWNIENQWFATFVYAKIINQPWVVSVMVGVSAAATTFSTFLFGTVSDRRGRRRRLVTIGYVCWGLFTIVYGFTEYIAKSSWLMAAIFVIFFDAVMSFFGSMGNDAGFNAWINDNMTTKTAVNWERWLRLNWLFARFWAR